MYSRTYDAQRFSPLEFVNRRNVSQLKTAWTKEMPNGQPREHPHRLSGRDVSRPAGRVGLARSNATNGDAALGIQARHDAGVADEDARDLSRPGLLRRAGRLHRRARRGDRQSAVGNEDRRRHDVGPGRHRRQSAHRPHVRGDAEELLHLGARRADRRRKPGSSTPPPETTTRAARAGAARRKTSGSRRRGDCRATTIRSLKLIYWGVANPTPNTRMDTARRQVRRDSVHRAGRSVQQLDAGASIRRRASWSWYYQHLPGDDWDEDYTHERTLLRTAVRPDPKFVKWINPDIRRGEQRDVAVMVGEGGGIFALDRRNGQFLWANPFPFDAPNFLISNVDGKTGKVTINKDLVFTRPGRAPRHLLLEHAQLLADGVPSASERAVRAVGRQLPRHDVGHSRATDGKPAVHEKRAESRAKAVKPEEFGGLAKINMETGEIQHIYKGRAPGQRRRAGDGRRPRVLGRSRRQVPGVRRRRPARFCGKRRSADRSTTARSPTR